MNRLIICLLLAMCFPAQSFAGKYDEGIRLLEAKSYVKAAAAFEAAAKEGDPGAERQLGFMYYRGLGFKQDNAKAVAQFEQAGTHGDLESQVNLGSMYENGLSVPQSDAKSAYWYRLAAEQGHRQSQFRFGEICYLGAGIPRDQAEATKWWDLAMRTEDDSTQRMGTMLQSVMNKIPAETWDEGHRRASEWLAARPGAK